MEANGNVDTAMTNKSLLLELYNDMKVVRPAVEQLVAANIIDRISDLERDKLVRSTAAAERSRIGSLTNKALAAVILVSQFLLGVWVAVANHVIAL